MTTVLIDLKKDKDVADLVAGLSVGDGVNLKTTIKSMDDQSLVLTVEEATEGEKYSDDDDDSDDMEDDDEPEGNGQDQRNPRAIVPPPPPRDRTNY